MTPAAGRGGQGRLHLLPPVPPAFPWVIRVGGAPPHQASPSRFQPPLRPRSRPYQEAGARTVCSRLPPTLHGADVIGELSAPPHALKPPTALPDVRVVPGWLGRILNLVTELRRGRAKVSVWTEAKRRGVSKVSRLHPTPYSLLPAHLGACRAELSSANPSQPQPRPQSQAYAEP